MEIFDNNSNKLLAIVHRYLSIENKKIFLTNPKEQFQMGAFNLPKGEEILKHVHLNNDRNVNMTPEGIVVLDGKLKVSVFNSKKELVKIVELNEKDSILLITGGHGIEVLEDSKFIEFKQGPYSLTKDKEHF